MINDFKDSRPLIAYTTKSLWKESDEKYSTFFQIELLKLHLAWAMADSDTDKIDLENAAIELRNKASSGIYYVLDKGKIFTGALADEISWGDAGGAERDYWLSEVNKVSPDIIINDEKLLHSIIFIASWISPSVDDVMKVISKKASKEMLETVGEKGVKKFVKASTKYASKKGASGIKKLSGQGIKGFMYEVKVIGKEGAYRLLGNKTEAGDILWEVFEKTHK